MLNERNIPLEEDGIEEEIFVEEELTITKAMWGDIGGNIDNQTDLQNALDAKQNSLTEAQLNAVNSGITAEKVTTYDGYASQIANKANQSALNAEAATREQADTALGRRIDDEAIARQNADNGLQTQIDAITSKSDVVDVVANYAALQAYDTSSLGNNDVIKVLDDETHQDALTYYRWSTTTQTWAYIGQEAPYYSKGQMDVMLQGKQDILTAGANIQIQNGTISATDTTYTAGNGLNLNGTEFSADTTILATKADLDNYYTKTETDTKLAPKLEAEVVAELPSTGTEGKLYLTPKAHTTQTATGNPITATVAEEAGAIESFQLDGDTFQQSYTGKNLLNIDEFVTAGGYAGLTVQIVNKDESTGSFGLKLTGNVAASLWSIYGRTSDLQLKPNTTYTLSRTFSVEGEQLTGSGGIRIKNGSSYTATTYDASATFTTDATGLAQILVYASYNQSGPSTNIDTIINFSNIQLEESSTATSFEPYVGGVPSPNPDYPQQIQTVTGLQTVEIQGRNLFDGITAHQLILSDGTISNNANWNLGDFIKVEPNTTYTVSFVLGSGGSHSILVSGFDSNKNFLVRAGSQGSTPYTFTTSSATEYIRLNYNNTNNDTDFQVELGSTPTAYAPYFKQTLPLDLGNIELNGLGDTYLDRIYKDGEDWKIHKATGKATLNSSSFGGWALTTGATGYTRADTQDRIGFPTYNGYCDKLTVRTGAHGEYEYIWFQPESTGRIYIQVSTSRLSASTIEAFNTWLDTVTPTAYYALVTPTDTTITDTALIAQLEAIRTASLQNGTNTITNTATGSNLAGDMEIGYYGFAPRNRYDKWLWLDINNEYEQIGN